MKRSKNSSHIIHKYVIPGVVGGILLILLIGTVISFMYQQPIVGARMMAQDIVKLASIFERIEQECGIISFDYQSNPINFLNIKKDGFVGSEVGSMNLAHPEKWQGPYLQDNLSMQQKDYQVVSTNKGYFIVPGQGVVLPNGKIIGKDLILDETSDIAAMMHDPKQLMFEDKPLAARLKTEKTVINAQLITALENDDE